MRLWLKRNSEVAKLEKRRAAVTDELLVAMFYWAAYLAVAVIHRFEQVLTWCLYRSMGLYTREMCELRGLENP